MRLSFFCATDKEKSGTMEDSLTQGKESFSSGKLEEARRFFEAVLQVDSRNKEALNDLGVIAYKNGEMGKAFDLISKALGIDPFYREGLLNFSHVLRRLGQLRQLVPHLERAIRRYPGDRVWVDLLLEAGSAGKQEPDRKGTNGSGAVRTEEARDETAPSGLRVLHGTMEIANQMNTYASGLRGMHVFAKTACYYPNYLGYESDYALNIPSFRDPQEANRKTRELASRLIPRFDVFHFHYGTSLTLDRSDLKTLKELKKKVFMNYWGSEVRVYEKAARINPYIRVKFQKDEESIKQNLAFVSRYVSDCIVADYEMYEYVRDYYDHVHFIPQGVDLKRYSPSRNGGDRSRPVVVHAPTDSGIKGSSDIIRVIEDLKNQYDLEFVLVQNKSHEEARKIYQTADIIIDSILEGAYGLFALETMAMGKPVVAWICDYMRDRYPKDLPIVSANPETLRRELEPLLKDRELREEIGLEGRKYVEKYHDASVVAGQLLRLYQGCEARG